MSCERPSEAGSRPQAQQEAQVQQPPPQRLDRGLGHFAQLHDLVRTISNQDAEARYREEAADNRIADSSEDDDDDDNGDDTRDSQSNRAPSDGKTVISWRDNDPENPHNFSRTRKLYILLTTMVLIINSTMGSALPSMAIPAMAEEWNITSESQLVLPMSCYLIGYVFGPVFWGPLSEHKGRRGPIIFTFVLFMVWTLACAVAPNWPAMLVFRFLAGTCASAPIAIVAGVLADIYSDTVQRGRAMAWFMATTVWGPLLAPIISGYSSTTIGWRWTFWIALIYAGATAVPVFFMPETYAPVLLAKRAARLRKADPSANVWASSELEPHDLKQLAGVVLTRPIRMFFTELIVLASCMYLALLYAIFYMSFQAFPLIFQHVYGLSPGVTGLCFLPIGAGALLAVPIFFTYDGILARARARRAPWAEREEARRVPLAFFAGPTFVASLLWLGWSARPEVPFAVPMLAGIPFGLGFQLIFMALINYLTDAYEIFAASANAAASSCRSLFAVVLPLATAPMFARLGISGACSLLAGLSACMCAIPFVFFCQGERLRAGSQFCIALREKKLEMEVAAEQWRLRKTRSGAAARSDARALSEKKGEEAAAAAAV